MNRRNFIKGIVGSFFILPSATTYARKWIINEGIWKPNPEWIAAPQEIYWACWQGEIKVDQWAIRQACRTLEEDLKNPFDEIYKNKYTVITGL
jgi:hypothetical protein